MNSVSIPLLANLLGSGSAGSVAASSMRDLIADAGRPKCERIVLISNLARTLLSDSACGAAREHRRHFLSIRDDGEGVPRDNAGRPDFRYVATHVCDSVKRRLKADGTSGLQGEFGIGLLSFWTVGDELSITSIGDDWRAYQMVTRKGDPIYVVKGRSEIDGGEVSLGTPSLVRRTATPTLDGRRIDKIRFWLDALVLVGGQRFKCRKLLIEI